MQDRNGLTIRGQYVLHSTAARDWYCMCGYKVVTRWFEEEPHWRSVCSNDENHDQNKFIHTGAIPYVQFQIMCEELEAQEIFNHLPRDLQEEIRKEEKRVTN